MVLSTLVFGLNILYSGDINHLGAQGIASLLSYANISHWLVTGTYWGSKAENSPFLHVWSLSLEEQFYLFFPIILYIVLKWFCNWIVTIFLILTLSSMLIYFIGTHTYPTATFYLLPTRAWELGIGAFLPILLFKYRIQFDQTRFKNNLFFTLAGIMLVLISYLFIGRKGGTSFFLFVPVFGTVLIIASTGHSNNILKHILSVSPLVYIGKISYSLYLWHWPILCFSKHLEKCKNIVFNQLVILVTIFFYFGFIVSSN